MKKNILLLIILLILIPVFVISLIYKLHNNTKSILEKKLILTTTIIKKNNAPKIKINQNNEIIELNLEDYVIGVVAGEMPASFEFEALKAQAIASRTYAVYKMVSNKNNYDLKTTTDDQVYITQDEMKNKWKEDYITYYTKIKKAVKETSNLIMKKNNKVFKSYYFAMSNGYTEDSNTVFGEKTIESVKSPWDNQSINKFLVTTEFSEKDLKEKLNINDSIDHIEIIKREITNRVSKIKINNMIYSGIEFRKLLGLRSTDFEIEQQNNNYFITTKGYGHGVGMSQYGANGMAKENHNYKEILEYYYQDIEIEEI